MRRLATFCEEVGLYLGLWRLPDGTWELRAYGVVTISDGSELRPVLRAWRVAFDDINSADDAEEGLMCMLKKNLSMS